MVLEYYSTFSNGGRFKVAGAKSEIFSPHSKNAIVGGYWLFIFRARAYDCHTREYTKTVYSQLTMYYNTQISI